MSKMKEIKAYKTKDGKVFENESKALQHEHETNIRERLEKICDEHMYRDMCSDDIATVLFENRLEFANILLNK